MKCSPASHVMEQVQSWIEKEIDMLDGLVALEGVEPLPKQGAYRTSVSPGIQSFVLCMSEEDECSVCHESMRSGPPVDLLRCCSKHFHKHCLDEMVLRRKAQSCPLCRSNFQLQPIVVNNPEAEQQVRDAGNRLLEHARKFVAAVVYKLRALKLGSELECVVSQPKYAGLLDEASELQEKRNRL